MNLPEGYQSCSKPIYDEDNRLTNNGCEYYTECIKKDLYYPLDEEDTEIIESFKELDKNDNPWLICPLLKLRPELETYIKLFNFCIDEKLAFTILPRFGGYYQQDNKTIEAFNLIKNIMIKHRIKEIKKEEAKIKSMTMRKR